ncbi:UNVERIFIED_CONTAM: hypothetical protein Scaly_0688700 [Sesamum calycinum]|uniref:Uncharacterized protein n=1 Tax=Sesamum calycinum TaxID=2727403 RepID=A0AAW2R6R5_9LAMI
MVLRSLDVKKDPFRHQKSDDELFGPKAPYLSAIGALIYLANHTRPDTIFAIIYQQDIVIHPRESIGMKLNIYFISLEPTQQQSSSSLPVIDGLGRAIVDLGLGFCLLGFKSGNLRRKNKGLGRNKRNEKSEAPGNRKEILEPPTMELRLATRKLCLTVLRKRKKNYEKE